MIISDILWEYNTILLVLTAKNLSINKLSKHSEGNKLVQFFFPDEVRETLNYNLTI